MGLLLGLGKSPPTRTGDEAYTVKPCEEGHSNVAVEHIH